MTAKQKTMRHAVISSEFAGSSRGQNRGKSPHSMYALSPYSKPLAAGVRLWCVLMCIVVGARLTKDMRVRIPGGNPNAVRAALAFESLFEVDGDGGARLLVD